MKSAYTRMTERVNICGPIDLNATRDHGNGPSYEDMEKQLGFVWKAFGDLHKVYALVSEERNELFKEVERLTPKGLRDESKRTNSTRGNDRASSH